MNRADRRQQQKTTRAESRAFVATLPEDLARVPDADIPAWPVPTPGAWTDPGDLVFDVYAGLGSVAVACALEGRRYVGAEIDPERHRLAGLAVAEALR